MPATCVLSLGNVLMSDDGLGPAVLRAFEQRYVAGPDVLVEDLGTPGLDLSPWLADADRIVLIDTVKASLPPGTLQVYSKADLLRRAPDLRVSPHDPGVKETLLNLEFAGRCPREITLVGIVPQVTTMGLELSPAIAAAVPAAVDAVVAALERFGVQVVARAESLAADAWWKIPVARNSSAPAAAGNPSHDARTPAN